MSVFSLSHLATQKSGDNQRREKLNKAKWKLMFSVSAAAIHDVADMLSVRSEGQSVIMLCIYWGRRTAIGVYKREESRRGLTSLYITENSQPPSKSHFVWPLTPAEEKEAKTSICAHYCSALYKYTDGSVGGTASKRLLPKSEKEKLINKCINVGMYKGLQGLAAPSLLLFSPPTLYPHTFQVQQLSPATPSPVATIERVREATSK